MGYDIGINYDGTKYDKFVMDNNGDIGVNSSSHNLLNKCLDTVYLPAKLNGVTVNDSLVLINNALTILEKYKFTTKYPFVKRILYKMLFWAENCPDSKWQIY